jgi:TPR repeat protein
LFRYFTPLLVLAPLLLLAPESIAETGDQAAAISSARAAAETGDANAQTFLGMAYQLGESVPQDDTKSAEWYKKGALGGNTFAQYRYAIDLQEGIGVKKDQAEANKWYRRSAEGGYSGAQRDLGECYRDGTHGIPKDSAEALKWLEAAAKQRDGDAEYSLGVIYGQGEGTSVDLLKAYHMFDLASQDLQGPDELQLRLRDKAKKNMRITYDDMSGAQRAALDHQNSGYSNQVSDTVGPAMQAYLKFLNGYPRAIAYISSEKSPDVRENEFAYLKREKRNLEEAALAEQTTGKFKGDTGPGLPSPTELRAQARDDGADVRDYDLQQRQQELEARQRDMESRMEIDGDIRAMDKVIQEDREYDQDQRYNDEFVHKKYH